MHILLVAATTFEIQPTIDFLGNSPTQPSAPSTSTPHHISTLITGIGTLPATWSLMRRIADDRPDLIIQAGIAGAFAPATQGDVLAIRDESLADLGVWENGQFQTLFSLRLADPNLHPFSGGRLVNPFGRLLALTGLQPAGSLNVNEISTDPDRIRWYRDYTNATTESMEGGALHYVCLQERIAFLQLRSVSNTIGIRDKTKWNIPLAITKLNDHLIRLLRQLNDHDRTILYPTNDAS
jgi:futalosine hydrolase